MTDKEIIIDGCEFQSDCIEYKDISYLKIMPICAIHELSIACHDKVNKCKYYKLYKQLKAKEQECETLVCQLDFEVQKKECLEQECEELKKQVNDLLNKPEIQDKILWKIDNEAVLGSKDAWIYKLEQTLAEIKDIAKNMNNECFYDDFECKDCDMKNGCTYFNKKQILQKICEVEN